MKSRPDRQFLIPRKLTKEECAHFGLEIGTPLLVRDPRSMKPLPESGGVKPWVGPQGRYWRRKVAEGSVIIGKPPVTKSATEKPTEQKRRNSLGGRKDGN